VRAALPCRLDATTAARVVLNPPPFLPEAPFERFPIGTTYVVEGRAGEHGKLLVSSRYVVLPGGQRIDIAIDFGKSASVRIGGAVRVGSARPKVTSAKVSQSNGSNERRFGG
jgi:hypothetical protein